MESVIRVLKTKSFTLNIMKFSWVVLIVVYAFGYGHIFSILEPAMKLILALSGIFITGGYYYMTYGYEHGNRLATTFGYVTAAARMILLELGTLFIGG